MPRGQITAPAGKVGTSCPHVSRRPCRAVEPRLPLLVYVSDCALQNSKSEFLRQWRRLPKDFLHMGQLTSRQETVGIRTESSSSARPLHAPSNYLHTLRERRGHMVAATSGGGSELRKSDHGGAMEATGPRAPLPPAKPSHRELFKKLPEICIGPPKPWNRAVG